MSEVLLIFTMKLTISLLKIDDSSSWMSYHPLAHYSITIPRSVYILKMHNRLNRCVYIAQMVELSPHKTNSQSFGK